MADPTPSLAEELETAFMRECENISKATDGAIDTDIVEMVAVNYAFTATQSISDAIMKTVERIDAESAAFVEARMVADRIIGSWSRFVKVTDPSGANLREPLRNLLKDLVNPTDSERLMMIVEEAGLYEITSREFKTILDFYQRRVPES